MRAILATAALVLAGAGMLLTAPGAQAASHCPADGADSVQLVSSEYATTRDSVFTSRNTGDTNATFDGAYATASSSYVTASASGSPGQGATIEPGESVSVTVSVEIDPSASESTHTVSIDIGWSGQSDCDATWRVTVVKDPLGSIAMDGSSSSLDLGETFKGDTPEEGKEIAGLEGRVEETTGFEGIDVSQPEVDCGDLSSWVNLEISGWPSYVGAGSSASFTATLTIASDTPYEHRGERIDCDFEAAYEGDDGGQRDMRGSVQGELLWPATLGVVDVDPVNVTFDEPKEQPPQTFTAATIATVENIGDEPMTLPAGTHSLSKGASLELLEDSELERISNRGNTEPVRVPAELHLSADMGHGYQELTGYVRTDDAGDGPVALNLTVHQPTSLRVKPETVELTGDEGVPIGELHPLPYRAFETYGYRNVTDAKLSITDGAPKGADERGDPEWIPRMFGPTTIAPGQPWDPQARDLGAALQFLPGAKPGCVYGYTFELTGDDVEPVELELLVEARQPDRQRILGDLDTVVGEQGGEQGSAVQEHLREALASVEIDPDQACRADPATVADNQRLLVAAGSAVTFFEDGVAAAASAGTVDVRANRLATAATALETIRQQRASMQTTGTAATELGAAIGVLEDRLRSSLSATAEEVYCDIEACQGELGPYLSAAQMLPEVAAIAGFEELETAYRQEAETFREEHRTLVTEAYERFQEADRSADEARRSHLVRVGDSHWLLNPIRYGFYMATTDEAVEDLQQSAEAFQQIGDGVMASRSENRSAAIQSAQAAAQNTFFLASFAYLGLFGLLVTHLVRSTLHYRRDAEEASDGAFLRVTESEPIAAGGSGGLRLPDPEPVDPEPPSPGPSEPETGIEEPSAAAETASRGTPKGPFTDGEPEVVRLDE